jgi:hypothetical protein
MSHEQRQLLLSGLVVLGGCQPERADTADVAPAVEVPPECAAVYDDADLTQRLAQLSGLTDASWPGFAPVDGTLVWIGAVGEGTCAVLWSGGGLQAVALLDEAPALSFGAYGWMLPEDLSAAFGGFLDQPASLRAWVGEHGADRATILPVASDYTPIVQLQLALHESFHVEIQADGWFATSDAWLSWADLSVDRDGTVACYAGWEDELAALRDGLAGDCAAAEQFLSLRDKRRAALSGLTVDAQDGAVPCLTAERIWEADEGLADEVSWGTLHDAGVASEAELLEYLGASADFPPYRAALLKTRWMVGAGTDRIDGFQQLLDADDISFSLDELFDQEVQRHCD